MKGILRTVIIETFSLYLVSRIAQGMSFGGSFATYFITGLAMALISIFAKPIINILLLPINLVTFGLFRWLSSSVILYIVTLLVKDFKILYFTFSGYTNNLIDIPYIHFEGILAFISFSFIISLITSFIFWFIK